LRPRARRDHGARDADRQLKPDQPVAVLAGQHAGLAARLELPRGRPDRAPGADVRRAGAAGHHAARQRRGQLHPGAGHPAHDGQIMTDLSQPTGPSPSLDRSLGEIRALRSAALTVGAWVVALLAAVPLLSVLYMLIVQGGARLSTELLTELPPAG